MKIIDLSQTNSVINCYMAQLRDVSRQTNRAGFRNNLQRIGQVMAYEISRQLDYSAKTIRTPLGQAHCHRHRAAHGPGLPRRFPSRLR